MGSKHGFSFSLKRASGISGMKGRISRKTGIPLSRSGRQRKIGRATGCCVPIAFVVVFTALISIAITRMI